MYRMGKKKKKKKKENEKENENKNMILEFSVIGHLSRAKSQRGKKDQNLCTCMYQVKYLVTFPISKVLVNRNIMRH